MDWFARLTTWFASFIRVSAWEALFAFCLVIEDISSRDDKLAKCAVTDIPGAVDRLGTIMARLKAAAGPGVRIVGMNYYLPALAEWRSGLPGHLVAWTAEKLAAT